jgi:hypothetical protein
MSMSADISNNIIDFCKDRELSLDDAIDLNFRIKSALEWIDDNEEELIEQNSIISLWELYRL